MTRQARDEARLQRCAKAVRKHRKQCVGCALSNSQHAAHLSNAGLRQPNPGENFVQLRYLYKLK